MILKAKKLDPRATLPAYATDGAAAFDLVAITRTPDGDTCTYGTGLAFEVPKGYVMHVYSRSSHGFRDSMRLVNCVGVIDSDYRGEVGVKLTRDNGNEQFPMVGERVAQAMLVKVPNVTIKEAEDLEETVRGKGGFGSTGK